MTYVLISLSVQKLSVKISFFLRNISISTNTIIGRKRTMKVALLSWLIIKIESNCTTELADLVALLLSIL